jgi:CheY-like chemotaxis protein
MSDPRRTVLVVEDGTEYTDAFRSLVANDSGDSLDLVRAGDGDEARRILTERRVDAVFLDVVFDRTPSQRLLGNPEDLLRRFGGDRRRAERHLAENQGFYLFNDLAPLLAESVPVVLAYDFSLEPERLAALQRTRERLAGVTDGTPISEVLETLRK